MVVHGCMKPVTCHNRKLSEFNITVQAKQHWIVFIDQSGVGENLAKSLIKNGDQVTLVGYTDAAEEQAVVVIDPVDLFAFQHVLKESAGRGQRIAGVVHLWSLDSAEPDVTDERRQRLSTDSLLLLMQAMVTVLDDADDCRLSIVSCGAQSIDGKEVLHPWANAMWGMARVFSLENPTFSCQCI